MNGLLARSESCFRRVSFESAQPNPSVAYDAIENEKLAGFSGSDKGWLVYRDAWTKFELTAGGNGYDFGCLLGNGEGKELGRLPRPNNEN